MEWTVPLLRWNEENILLNTPLGYFSKRSLEAENLHAESKLGWTFFCNVSAFSLQAGLISEDQIKHWTRPNLTDPWSHLVPTFVVTEAELLLCRYLSKLVNRKVGKGEKAQVSAGSSSSHRPANWVALPGPLGSKGPLAASQVENAYTSSLPFSTSIESFFTHI